jgi:hypothetical protein
MLEWLEKTQFSAWARGESLWGWPFALTVHAFGTAVVVGFILIISLRLFGFFETIPYSSLQRLFPAIWIAFGLQFLSGFTLWMTKPTRYVTDGAFLIKFSLVTIGVILTLYFYATMKREGGSWQAKAAVSSRGAKFAAAALLVWCSVLVAGRLTAYLGSLYTG